METLQNAQEILSDFAIFILSHGNPNNVITASSLKKYGYTGKWYIVLDTDDATIPQYREKYGTDRILIFDKSEIAGQFDTMDAGGNKNVVVYARNACFDLAEQIGVKYFMELDDDYYEFVFRFEDDGHLRALFPTNLAIVLAELLDYYKSIPQFKSLAIGQCGDFMGGVGGASSQFHKRFLRKAMNTFICSTDRRFTFTGTLNEDVNAYCLLGSRGELFATVLDFAINQIDTQQATGGMTNVYTGDGTYLKSFYTVLCCPSFVKVGILGNNHVRVHHNVDWEHAVPKIISDRFKVRE